MKAKKMQKANDGIRCVVNTCYYYMAGDHCTAEKISVEPRNASDYQETDCVTFLHQDNQ